MINKVEDNFTNYCYNMPCVNNNLNSVMLLHELMVFVNTGVNKISYKNSVYNHPKLIACRSIPL